MAGPFDTQIGIGVRDNATPGIKSIRNEVTRMYEARERLGVQSEHRLRRAIQQTEASLNRLARSGTLSAAELSRAQEKAAAKISRLQKEMAEAEVRSYTRRNAAREAYAALGIRSEHSIQREIQRTEAAYNRLERSGVLSARELQRAQEKNIATVARLRKEIGEATRQERTLGERFRRGAAVAVKIGGAVIGTGMLLRGPINDASAYDATLRREANFAYSDRDAKGRLKGMTRISSAVRDAVDKTGAAPEEAFIALETMWRSGVMSKEKPYKYLNNVLRNAAATGADAASVANTQASAVNFGLSDKDAPAALSVLTTMAQHGRVDVPELAREMPRGLESGKSAGFYGRRGFSQLAAFFEASAIGAKDPQDAATNANDFLAELTSSNLANNAGRIRIHGRKLDIRAMMRRDLAQGRTALDTITGVIGKMDETDPDYHRLQERLASTTDSAVRAQLDAQIAQIHGQHISRLFPNQQARNAYLNFDRNRAFFSRQVAEGVSQFSLPDGKRSADQDWALVSDGPQWKTDREKHMAVVTSNDTMKGAAGLWGDLMNHLADLEQKLPALATAVSGTTSAFNALGGSGIGTMGAGWLLGGGYKKIKNFFRGGASATEAGAVTEGAENVIGAVSKKPGWLSRAAGVGGRYGGKVAAGLGWLGEKFSPIGDALMGGEVFYSEHIQRGKNKVKENGGKVPSYMPQPVGALDVWDEIANWLNSSGTSKPQPKTSQTTDSQQQPISVFVTLDGQQIAATVETRIGQNARRHGA